MPTFEEKIKGAQEIIKKHDEMQKSTMTILESVVEQGVANLLCILNKHFPTDTAWESHKREGTPVSLEYNLVPMTRFPLYLVLKVHVKTLNVYLTMEHSLPSEKLTFSFMQELEKFKESFRNTLSSLKLTKVTKMENCYCDSQESTMSTLGSVLEQGVSDIVAILNKHFSYAIDWLVTSRTGLYPSITYSFVPKDYIPMHVILKVDMRKLAITELDVKSMLRDKDMTFRFAKDLEAAKENLSKALASLDKNSINGKEIPAFIGCAVPDPEKEMLLEDEQEEVQEQEEEVQKSALDSMIEKSSSDMFAILNKHFPNEWSVTARKGPSCIVECSFVPRSLLFHLFLSFNKKNYTANVNIMKSTFEDNLPEEFLKDVEVFEEKLKIELEHAKENEKTKEKLPHKLQSIDENISLAIEEVDGLLKEHFDVNWYKPRSSYFPKKIEVFFGSSELLWGATLVFNFDYEYCTLNLETYFGKGQFIGPNVKGISFSEDFLNKVQTLILTINKSFGF